MTAIYIKDCFFFFNVFEFGLVGATDAPVGQQEKKTQNFLRKERPVVAAGNSGLILQETHDWISWQGIHQNDNSYL